ncbi:MAG TPA: hypothetical protein VH280_16165 [Verrucomicrobiae bacterium]|jgi:hypothetical protein|nr:hypothetical protein [Verrucomicrobiae bacterium]
MKTNQRTENVNRLGAGTAFSKACRACYAKILAQIRNAREAILAEARETVAVQERLLRLAVNEAEALAWQTLYPQLVFPSLAMEKIRGAAQWSTRQRRIA